MIFAPGTTIGGRYKLKEELAKGGMGAVWVARHLQLDVDVAIKFMAPETVSSPVARARFEREAKASAQLQYPHIVHVNDFGFEGETPFLVMELLRGESLESRLQREFRLPFQATAAILVQIAKGLRKAHEAGLVHRDLKPGNIFITGTADEEIVKILDFGIAKQTGGALLDSSTKTGEFMGSPHYMSPEQIRDARDLDGRSDLWSLGVILYRALTGELPFPGGTIGVVMGNIFSAPIPKPSHCMRGLPGGIDGFFERAFERDRTKRFESARDMTEAFLQLGGAAGQAASMGLRAPGSSWTTQKAAPVEQDDAKAFEAATQIMGSRSRFGAPDVDERGRTSEPSPMLRAPAVGGASLRAVGPKERRGRTTRLPMPAAESTSSASPTDPPRAGSWPGNPPDPRGLPMMGAGTLTVSPSADRTIRPQSGEPDAVGDMPPKSFLERRGMLLVGVLAAAVIVIFTTLIVLRSSAVPETSPAQAPPGSPLGSVRDSAPFESVPALSGEPARGEPPQGAPASSASAADQPAQMPSPEGNGAEAVRPTMASPRSGSPAVVPSAVADPTIPNGQGRLSVSAKGGSCRVTINQVDHGSTPTGALIKPGSALVQCRRLSGTQTQSVRVVEGKTTFVTFNLG